MKALFDGVIGDILGMAPAAFLFFLVQEKSIKNIGDILGMAPAAFLFFLTHTHTRPRCIFVFPASEGISTTQEFSSGWV